MPDTEHKPFRIRKFVKTTIPKLLSLIIILILLLASAYYTIIQSLTYNKLIIFSFYSLIVLLFILGFFVILIVIYYFAAYMRVSIISSFEEISDVPPIYLHPDTLRRKKLQENQQIAVYYDGRYILGKVKSSNLIKKSVLGVSAEFAPLLQIKETSRVKIGPIQKQGNLITPVFF